jgi:hypothetical protein
MISPCSRTGGLVAYQRFEVSEARVGLADWLGKEYPGAIMRDVIGVLVERATQPIFDEPCRPLL